MHSTSAAKKFCGKDQAKCLRSRAANSRKTKSIERDEKLRRRILSRNWKHLSNDGSALGFHRGDTHEIHIGFTFEINPVRRSADIQCISHVYTGVVLV